MSSKKKIIIICVAVAIALALIATIATSLVFFLINNTKVKTNSSIKEYTVTFNTDGGSTIEPKKVSEGQILELPEDLEKDGFKFLYWVGENEQAVSAKIKITKDITLTAIWAEKDAETVIVKFDTDGGSTINDLEVVKGEKIVLPENPTKNGYAFKKWTLNETDFDKEMTIEENITLKAVWEKKKEEPKTNTEPKTVTTEPEVKNDEPKNTEPQNVDVTGISLDKSQVDLIIGKTGKLNATITPANATNKSVSWASSDSNIISVDASGNITAKGIGSATVTVTTANGKSATATVYSDVESITLSSSLTYITKYSGQTGAKSQTTLTVKTTPEVDASLIKWNAPDASGSNAAAYFSGSGKNATITARDTWGSNYSSIPVTVYVGRKTSNKVTIYVEPQLSLYFSEGNPTGSTNAVNKNVKVKLNSNIPVNSWSFNSEAFATNIYKTDRWVSFTTRNTSSHQEGFRINAKSKAGQEISVPVSVNAM